MIDVSVVQNIVERMKSIINQEINFFSTSGVIVASTDHNRIGQLYHEAAQKVLSTMQPVVIEYEGQYEGARQGINLPVIIENKIVGVIGITGKKEEVLHFGEIIKQMTEILILNNSARELVFNRRNINHHIIDYILQPENNSNLNVEILYDIDFRMTRYAIVGLPLQDDNHQWDTIFSSLYLEIEMIIGDLRQNAFDIRGDLITILFNTSSEQHAKKITQKIRESLSKKYGISYIFGIGNAANSVDELQKSLVQAKSSLKWNRILNLQSVLTYNELGLGIALNDIKSESRQNFLKSIFFDKSRKEIDDIVTLLITYEKNNGSLQKCADELFIHKNTVQYQLNKIHEETGYSPRNLTDFFTLKLATILYQIEKNEGSVD